MVKVENGMGDSWETHGRQHKTSKKPQSTYEARLFGRQDDTLVLFASDELQGVLKVLLARLDRRGLLLVAGQVGMDELNQPV